MFELPPSLPLPTKEIILSQVSDYQIFKFYFPDYEPGEGATYSPLRKDNVPSFNIFYAERNRMLMFKDFATKDTGDCFVFVSRLFGLSFPDTLSKICADFGVTGVYIPNNFNSAGVKAKVPKVSVDYSTINKIISIRVKTKPFTQVELDWWKSFGISFNTLKKYKVFSLSKVFINSYIINTTFSFGYLEAKDGVYTWKIYSPLDPKNKWINNCNSKILQGWTQMPDKADFLILEKALKDSMTIDENWGYATCSLQNEGVSINPPVLRELKERFPKIYYLGDNDKAGIEFSERLCEEADLIPIFIPDMDYKNISDLYKGCGKDYSGEILKQLLNNAD